MNPRHVLVPLLLTALASVARAQVPPCPVVYDPLSEIYPTTPLTYPMTSDRYAVQYQLGLGSLTPSQVYISYYGGTDASPYHPYSGYPTPYPRLAYPLNVGPGPTDDAKGAPRYLESMSFVSIPASADTTVTLRVTKLWGSPFPATVSVRPSAKAIHVDWVNGFTVQLSTKTADDFLGEQFVLWWDGDSYESSAIEGLAFFLDPPYVTPTGSNVKPIAASSDLAGDLSPYDTLEFEGIVAVESSNPASTGAQAFIVPANIDNVFLGPGSWLQGKLRFEQSGAGHVRRLYGPGVLDVSRFNYSYRHCIDSTDPAKIEYGYPSISKAPLPNEPLGPALPDRFIVDGIIASDGNYYATDLFENSALNNVKVMSWNGNNDGLELGMNTSVSNVFVRVGDDSLKMWRSYITVNNATVWQNFNGGVVNLGWSDNTPGDGGRIDGLYVVKTDWKSPKHPKWDANTLLGELNDQNNAVVDSMMTPGTKFGTLIPSVYRNIYVEDPPQVLFSLKILPEDCGLLGLTRKCPSTPLTLPGVLNLNIKHVSTPASIVENSIGFQNATSPEFTGTLTGSMNIGLNDVNVTSDGTVTTLTSANAKGVGKIGTNGNNVNIDYQDSYQLDQQWFAAWTAAPGYEIPTPPCNDGSCQFFSPLPSALSTNTGTSMTGSSVRMIVRPTISGTAVRVKLENTVGQYPVEFSAAYYSGPRILDQ